MKNNFEKCADFVGREGQFVRARGEALGTGHLALGEEHRRDGCATRAERGMVAHVARPTVCLACGRDGCGWRKEVH